MITHITRYSQLTLRERALDEIDALFEEILGGWDTFEAYRSRFAMLNKCFDGEPLESAQRIAIFNDLTGALFSRIYPMIARRGGHIFVYSDMSETFSFTEFALDMRSTTVKYEFEYTPNFETLISAENELIATDCDVLVVHGVLDYLPDDISFQLLQKLSLSLKKGGQLLVTGLTSTSDEILVSDFLGLVTIRRRKEDFISLCDAKVFSDISYQEKDGGVLLRLTK